MRPGLDSFLNNMSKKFYIYLFTAATKDYADQVLWLIDPKNSYFTKCFYWDSIEINPDGCIFKDLSKFNFELNKTIIVDNLRDNFKL